MSADNGIYILKTPARPIKTGNCYENQHGKYEYRVAVCTAIENVEYSDLYVPLYFADSRVHYSSEEAQKEANQILSKNEDIFFEYGICVIEKHINFPNMTRKEAAKALDAYVERRESNE